MPIENIVRHKTGMEIFRLFDSIFADIWRQVQLYENLKGSDINKAIEHLKNAITKPANVQARLQKYVVSFTSAEAIAAIGQVSNDVTIGELNTELTSMVNYCANLKNQIDTETITWDEVSIELQNNFENIIPKIALPFPDGYQDIWGR